MELLLTISSIILIISLYVNYNLYSKFISAQSLINENDNKFVEFYLEFVKSFNLIQKVDKGGAYSTEDEVGYAFNIIKGLINDMHLQFKTIINGEGTQSEE